MTQTIVKVEGMSCQHCVKAVEGAAMSVKGVAGAKADLKSGAVTVEHDGTAEIGAIRGAIEDQGYDVVVS